MLLFIIKMKQTKLEKLEHLEQSDVLNDGKNMGKTVWEVLQAQELSVGKQDEHEWKKSEFDKYQEVFVYIYWFSELEFLNLCKYFMWWDVLKCLDGLMVIIENYDVQKAEIMNAMREVKLSNSDIFCNYVLIKRKAKMFEYKDVKRVIDKWYARAYITDSLEWIELVWTFDSAIAALRLAIKEWLFSRNELVYTTKESEPTISDFWQALIDAWVISE